jgi:hypothetical protein
MSFGTPQGQIPTEEEQRRQTLLQNLADPRNLSSLRQGFNRLAAERQAALGDPSRLNLILQQEEKQKEQDILDKENELELELAEALRLGDNDRALAIAAQLNRGSIIQLIQGRENAARNRARGEIFDGGKYIVRIGEDGEPEVTVNQEIIDSELAIQKAEQDAKPKVLPTALAKIEEDDRSAVKSHTFLKADINNFIKLIDEGKLEYGTGESIQSFLGGFAPGLQGPESTEKRLNFAAFNRWVTTYVNERLKLNKGPQTDGDALRALDEIKATEDIQDVKRILQDLLKISDREIAFRKGEINRRREEYQVPAASFQDTVSYTVKD